jgi:hypothetical protein
LGRFPENRAEWDAFEPRAAELLVAPRWSRNGDYEINFDALGDPSPMIVIADPGMRWPGDPDRTYDLHRVWLRNDGVLIGDNPNSPDPYVRRELPSCDELDLEHGEE